MRLTDRRTMNRLLDIVSESLRAMTDQDLMIEVKQVAERLGKIETREAARELFASIDRPRKRDFLVRVAQASGV